MMTGQVQAAGKAAQRHLTQQAMPERLKLRFSRRLQTQRSLLRKRSFFNPQGCEILREF